MAKIKDVYAACRRNNEKIAARKTPARPGRTRREGELYGKIWQQIEKDSGPIGPDSQPNDEAELSPEAASKLNEFIEYIS